MNEGKPWIVQREHIPYPVDTMAESAQLHIDEIIAEHNVEPKPSKMDLLRQELTDTKQQLTETQDALIELADLIVGGAK